MPKGVKTTDDKIAEIQRLKSEGKPIKEICETVGVSPNIVTRTCKKKKEPATAATAASTEKNVDENISASIVTENTEDVKTPHMDFFNSAEEIAVVESVADKIERYTNSIIELTAQIKLYERERDMLCGLLRRNGYGNVLTAIDNNIRRNKEENSV